MKNYNLSNVIILLLIFSNLIFSQNENSILAKVGSEIITGEEFQDRYDFMPHLNYSNSNPDTLKKEFLYSLIAEKLWAFEGLENRVDTNTVFVHSLKSLEKLFVKDELFRREVESKIMILNHEIIKALDRFNKNIFIKFIVSVDSSEIYKTYLELSAKNNFDSLVTSNKNIIAQTQSMLVKVGSMENEFIEDILFSMNKDQYTVPIRSKGKWFIIKIDSISTEAETNDSPEMKRNKVLNVLTERRRRILANNFLDKILGGRSIKSSKVLFDKLLEKLYSILENKYKTTNNIKDNIVIDGIDIINAYQGFNKEILSSEFARINKSVLTLNDLIFYLFYQKLEITSLDKTLLRKILNNSVRQFLEDEMIIAEAYNQGLEKSESVKKNLKVWYNYYLAEYQINSLKNLVANLNNDYADSNNKINLLTKGEQVNIVEIFNKDLDSLNKVLNEINRGADFSSLADRFNQREHTKASKGEWGYFLPTAAGEIGRVVLKLKIGEIYGPVKIDNGYSIIKLIDRRVFSDSLISSFEISDFEKERNFLSSFDKLLNKKTAELAQKYKININNDLLKNIYVSDINIFTYKLIGFGGKIAALPITIPIYNWFKEFQNSSKVP